MRTCDRTNFCSMSAWLSSSSSESHLYSFFSLLSSHPVRCNELERCESQRTVPIKWLTPEKLLLDRRHFGKERFRTWWECLSAFTRIITAGQLSPVTVVTESSRNWIAKPVSSMSFFGRNIFFETTNHLWVCNSLFFFKWHKRKKLQL